MGTPAQPAESLEREYSAVLSEFSQVESELSAIERQRVAIRRAHGDVPIILKDHGERLIVSWPPHPELRPLGEREAELMMRRNQLLSRYANLREKLGLCRRGDENVTA